MGEALIAVYEAYIEASLAYDDRRFTMLRYFFVGMSAIFAFWFNTGDHTRRRTLFGPLVVFTVVATAFSAYLVFIYSKDSHVYFIYAEKVMRQVYDIVVTSENMSRGFFVQKWNGANQQFWDVQAGQTILIWNVPMLIYAGALLGAAFVAHRAGKAARS